MSLASKRHLPLFPILIALGIFTAGLYTSASRTINWDVAWLLHVGERLLQGAVYGHDIIEGNPPASPWLYLPVVLMGRASGLDLHFIVVLYVFIVMAVSLGLTLRLLMDSPGAERWLTPLLLAMLTVFAVMPMQEFGQREHFIEMLYLPYAAIAMGRSGGLRPPLWASIVVGAMCGVALSIKPVIVFAAIAPPVVVAFYQKDWRFLFVPEALAGAGVTVAYALAAILLHPEYQEVLPLFLALYLPSGTLPSHLPQHAEIAFYLALITCLLLLLRQGASAVVVVLLTSTVCFWIAYWAQGKPFFYHQMPMISMVVATLTVVTFDGSLIRRRVLGCLMLAVMFQANAQMSSNNRYDLLAAKIREHKENASMMALGSMFATGHPTTILAGGRWLGRLPAAWPLETHRNLLSTATTPEVQAERDRWRNWARDVLAEDLVANRPDIVLAQRGPVDWFMILTNEAPALRRLMGDYCSRSRGHIFLFAEIEMYVRKDLLKEGERECSSGSGGTRAGAFHITAP